MNERPTSASALSALYFVYYGAFAVYGPFMAVYLVQRGFSTRASDLLLASMPVLRVLTTPAWAVMADRLQSATRVLRVALLATLVTYALVPVASNTVLLAVVLLLFTAARSPASSLLDTIAFDRVRRVGGEFGAMRVWGTVGYTLCTFGAGLLIQWKGVGASVPVAFALLVLCAFLGMRLSTGASSQRVRILPALRVLLSQRRFRFVLGSAVLHQMGLAVYDALFPAYLTSLSGARYAGAALACGATAEVLFMLRARAFIARIGSEWTLVLAYGSGVLRWALLAVLRDPRWLVAVQVLHALTFGAFYLAAISTLDRDSPAEVRASAQGAFASIAWGIGSGAGIALAGYLRSRGGMNLAFVGAASGCAIAMVWALREALRGRSEHADASPAQ